MLRKLMKINTALVLLSLPLAIASCKKEEKKAVENTEKPSTDSIKTAKVEDKIDYTHFNIYNISIMSSAQKNELADVFISVSDIYNEPHAIQEDAFKNQKNKSTDQMQRLELDPTHRKKMLDGLRLTESDSLFLYNYEINKLQKVPLNKLKAVAYLNPYTMDDEELDSSYYMLGFEIATEQGNDVYDKYNNAIAYFGNKNPFIEGKMKPIPWKKANADLSKKYFTSSKLKPGKTYQAHYENMNYYLQDYLEEEMVIERKLVVMNDRNEKISEKTFSLAGTDGAEFSPLNGIEADGANNIQWTGYLFKGKPAVAFGFLTQSFGCPTITFLDQKEKDFTINCDNRH